LFDRYESEQFPKSKVWLNQKFSQYQGVTVHEMDDFDWERFRQQREVHKKRKEGIDEKKIAEE
jgi:hypothetical protein